MSLRVTSSVVSESSSRKNMSSDVSEPNRLKNREASHNDFGGVSSRFTKHKFRSLITREFTPELPPPPPRIEAKNYGHHNHNCNMKNNETLHVRNEYETIGDDDFFTVKSKKKLRAEKKLLSALSKSNSFDSPTIKSSDSPRDGRMEPPSPHRIATEATNRTKKAMKNSNNAKLNNSTNKKTGDLSEFALQSEQFALRQIRMPGPPTPEPLSSSSSSRSDSYSSTAKVQLTYVLTTDDERINVLTGDSLLRDSPHSHNLQNTEAEPIGSGRGLTKLCSPTGLIDGYTPSTMSANTTEARQIDLNLMQERKQIESILKDAGLTDTAVSMDQYRLVQQKPIGSGRGLTKRRPQSVGSMGGHRPSTMSPNTTDALQSGLNPIQEMNQLQSMMHGGLTNTAASMELTEQDSEFLKGMPDYQSMPAEPMVATPVPNPNKPTLMQRLQAERRKLVKEHEERKKKGEEWWGCGPSSTATSESLCDWNAELGEELPVGQSSTPTFESLCDSSPYQDQQRSKVWPDRNANSNPIGTLGSLAGPHQEHRRPQEEAPSPVYEGGESTNGSFCKRNAPSEPSNEGEEWRGSGPSSTPTSNQPPYQHHPTVLPDRNAKLEHTGDTGLQAPGTSSATGSRTWSSIWDSNDTPTTPFLDLCAPLEPSNENLLAFDPLNTLGQIWNPCSGATGGRIPNQPRCFL